MFLQEINLSLKTVEPCLLIFGASVIVTDSHTPGCKIGTQWWVTFNFLGEYFS